MAPDDWPEWLPTGWTMQIRKIDQRTVKCYLDPEGHKFYSKPQVFRHLKTINNSTASEKSHNAYGPAGDIYLEPDVPHKNEVPESLPHRRSITGSSSRKSKETVNFLTGGGSSSEPDASRKDGVSEWLPDGWIMEVKTQECGSRVGMKYKCYTDPVSGRKFYSKPQVLKYLSNTNIDVADEKKGAKSSRRRGKSRKSEVTSARNKKAKRKRESIRKSSDYEVFSRTPADGLPPGWIKEIRLRKNASLKKKDPYYLDPLSGYTFFSKLDALRYLDTGDIKNCAMKPLKRDMNEKDDHKTNLTGGKFASQPGPSCGNETSELLPNGCVVEPKTKESGTKYKKKARSLTGDGSSSKPGASQKDEVSEWLPDGWIAEVKVRDTGARFGMRYKCYTDPVSGRKFFSKPQVLNYLAGANSSIARKRKGDKSSVEPDSPSNSEAADVRSRNRSKKKKKHFHKSTYSEVISTSPADELPPGWIKEIRIRKYATHERRDPYYTDPSTGYVFRSKLDALRYLETGDINICAIKPKKKDIDGKETPVAAVDGHKPVNATTKKHLFEDKEAENSVKKQHNDVSTDAAVPPTESLEENHTDVGTDQKTAENTSVSTPARGRATRIPLTKRSKSSASLPGRSSKRLKEREERAIQAATQSEVQPETERNDSSGCLEDGVAVQQKQVAGTNVGKQPDGEMGESQVSYEVGDSAWTDQCLDFAVKTLTGEIPVPPISVPSPQESVGADAGMNENPTKVN